MVGCCSNTDKRKKINLGTHNTDHHCSIKDFTLPKKRYPIKSGDSTEKIVVNIPCRLAERAQRYAKEHDSTIEGVVIEALDALLGGRTTDGFK
jgi:hypothetical protein